MPHQRHSSQEESVSQLVGVIRHEFNMSVRRKGLWIAYLIVFGFFCLILVREGLDHMYSGGTPWQEAGETVYLFNMLLPLIGGILAADRMQRDHRLGVRELQTSAPLSHTLYILGKYAGVLLSLLLPMFLWVVGLSIFSVTMGLIGPAIIGAVVVAFAAIAIPSFAFVIAFSLACPLVMPLRTYQILFTGYWFWGNFLSNEVFPTISGTLLNASGVYAQQGFFSGTLSQSVGQPLHTAPEAWLNILALGLCTVAALFILSQYLAWKARRA
jgi:ABC-2 type transport system permease protein